MAKIFLTRGRLGISLAVPRALIAGDYTVIAIARQESDGLAAMREQAAGSIYFLPFDLSEIDKLHGLARDLSERFGPIYGLVNNAALGTDGILATMPVSSIQELVRLNTVAPIVLTKYIVRSMMNEGAGRIVNISSIIANTGYSGLSVYGATKASMIGFPKSLAREVGSLAITVNAVGPGFLETELTASMNEQ